jgi:hypothetical protein
MSLKVAPPFVERCQRTVGAGRPLAAVVKVAVLPAPAVVSRGWVVIAGAVRTLSSAALVVTVPELLVNTARKRCPSSVPLVLGVV